MPNPKNTQPLFQVLSLDVVLGSIATGILAVKLLNVAPNVWWWLILPMSVWVIYTLDHLFDSRVMKGSGSIYRHNFHYKNRKMIGTFCLILGVSAVGLSYYFVNFRIILGGFILGSLSLLYFLLINKSAAKNRLIQKEFFIAVIYVAGVFLAPLVWHDADLSLFQIIVILTVTGLAWGESILISWYDFKSDQTDEMPSFTQREGKEQTAVFLTGLYSALIGVCIFLMVMASGKTETTIAAILLIMTIVLLMLVLLPKRFEKHHRFRWIGEGIFLLPALLLLL